MKVEAICAMSAIVACLIIIAVHTVMLFDMDHDVKMKLGYRCIICAYFIFLLQHMVELTAGYLHAIV